MLPKDPNLLLSVVNTRLRDQYASLDDLCSSLNEDAAEIAHTLETLGYHYDAGRNQFLSHSTE